MPQGIAITFPSNPTEGQTHLAQNGFTYIYSSLKNQWKRGGDFVRAPKVLSFAGVAATTTGAGVTTGPLGGLIYNVPGFLIPSSDVGVDSYKAYRYTDSYPNYTEIQVSISSAFSSVAYAATSTSTTFSIPAGVLSANTTYYVRARQFVGSSAGAAATGAISGYSQNIVSFATTSVFLDTPTIVSIANSTQFPVYQIGFAGTTLPATVTYSGSGLGNLEKVEWRVTGPRNPDSTGDVALAEVGIGTFSSATLANALVLAMPFSGATGVGITNDVNNAIRTASGASAGTTKTVTANGGIGTASVGIATTTAHFYSSAAYFDGSNDTLSVPDSADLDFGTGDFTIEFWMNQTSSFTDFRAPFGKWGATTGFTMHTTAAGKINFYDVAGGAGALILASNITLSLNRWYHISFVRKSGILGLYVDGALDGAASYATNVDNNVEFLIGNLTGFSRFFGGYMQDFKIYKGLAKYQENFTPPLPTYGTISYTTRTIGSVGVATTAFFESTGDIPTAEASSTAANALVLAMPMNRTFGFQDINVAVRGLTSGASAGTAKTVGLGTTSTANAPTHPRISSTESKWYDGAAYFDGGDYLNAGSNSDYSFGTGDFTVEAWVYQTADSAYAPIMDIGTHGNTTGILFITRAPAYSNATAVYSGGSYISSYILPLNTWVHLAYVRRSGVLTIYANGVNYGSFNFTNNLSETGIAYIGSSQNYGYYFPGYITDFKIYKGFAKYTANFTPPQPICGFTTDLSIQTGFTTTSATGVALTSIVGLGSTSTLAFGADQNLVGVTSITSSSGITTLPDPYAQNLVLALPLANIVGVGTSFTNDRNTQIRSVSITGAGVTAGTTKTITNTGVTTVSISTSKYYGNTASFNGTSSFLNITPRTDFTPTGNTPFTFEAWIYPTASTDGTIFGTYFNTGSTGAGGERGFLFYYNSSRTITVYMRESFSAGNVIPSTTTSIPLNTWTHLAIQIGAQTDIYFDGVLQPMTVSYFNSTSADGTRNPIVSYHASAVTYLGANIGTGTTTSFFNGYIQDAKVYNNFRKYTSNFTPPPPMFGDYTRSTPNKIVFTPGSDYVLEARNTATGGIVTSVYSATRQWGTKPKGGIYDPYGANLVLAIPGGAVSAATSTYDVTGQIRYETPTASYVNAGIVTYSNSLGIGTYGNKTVTNNGVTIETSVNKYYGRSMYFNSAQSDTMTVSSTDFGFGTGDFTYEFWGYRVTDGNQYFLDFGSNVGPVSGSVATIAYYNTTTNNMYFLPVTIGTWNHFAVCRKNGVTTLFTNGILSNSKADTYDYGTSSRTLTIGNYGGGGYLLNGYITDLRVYKGVAKYTANFTPPNQIYLT